jgi:hypothetical protein
MSITPNSSAIPATIESIVSVNEVRAINRS